MELQKMLKKISFVRAHPDMMTASQVDEWFKVLYTLEGARIDDVSGATPIRCKQGCLQSKFTIHFGNIAKMDVILTRVHPESKKYSVSSRTEYCNGFKFEHGAKKPNTWQQEVLRQQDFFMQQQHAATQHAIDMHQQHVNQHMQHVMLHDHIHNNNF
jgi:hypothetical protein